MHPIERLRWIARDRDEAPTALAVEAAWAISELALEEPPAVVTACRRLVESHVTFGPLWWVAATLLVCLSSRRGGATSGRRALLGSDGRAPRGRAEPNACRANGPLVVACPAETVLEACSHRESASRRVWSLRREHLRAEVRRFGAVASKASGWDVRRRRERRSRGAAVVLVEALAAGSRGVLVTAAAASLAWAAKDASVPVWGVAGVGSVLHDQLFGEVVRRARRRCRTDGTGRL